MQPSLLDRHRQRIEHAGVSANAAQRVRDLTTARCVQELALEGYSQREIADRLDMSKSTVNRLAKAVVTYTPEGGSGATLCDAIESGAWGTPVAMRENYVAITGSHTTCPRCGGDLEVPEGRFCGWCRFPFAELYPFAAVTAVP